MDTKETILRSLDSTSMLDDREYYKYIFKKTEKIACAVFYILRFDGSISQNDHIVKDLEMSAIVLLNVSLSSLRSTAGSIAPIAVGIKYALIELESKLRIASSARYVSTELLEVFYHEIDSVQRMLRKYTESTLRNPLTTELSGEVRSSHEKRVPRLKTEVGISEDGASSNIHMASRKERVLNVIRDKGNATIKDIIEVVKDCSEKTIQRELIVLIKDGIIIREGERRWSKYRLV